MTTPPAASPARSPDSFVSKVLIMLNLCSTFTPTRGRCRHALSRHRVWGLAVVLAVVAPLSPDLLAQETVEIVVVQPAENSQTNSASVEDSSAAESKPTDAAEVSGAAESVAAEPTDKTETTEATEPSETEGDNAAADDPNEPKKISVSFRGTELTQIAQFFGRELNKPVLIHQSLQNIQLTVMSDKELPVNQAFELIGNALRQNGVIVVEGPRQIELLPIDQVRRINRPLVEADESVADLPDQSTIIDKIFVVEHYDVNRLKDLVVPMLPEYAFLVADPNLDRLVVTAAAADLIFVERMVKRLDVPRADDTVERIFTIKHGDASEIATMVRTILAGTLGNRGMEVFTTPGPQGNNNRNNNSRNNRSNNNRGGGNNNNAESNTLFIERSEAPIMLQADISRNWIIAAAPPSVMETIEKWITELDQPKDRNEPYELFDITHADVEELAGQINEAINAMPDADIRASVRVIPFVKSRQILVYGSQRGRALVRSLLEQLDIESSQYQMIKEIQLEHDSAENVKAKIEELFGSGSGGGSGNRYYFSRGSQPADKELTVTADTQRNTVTIMTDPLKMRRIETIIEEQWDLPVNLDDVKPKVYELKHTDPVQVQTLLEEMFTKSSSSSSFSFFSGRSTTETSTPVGRLFGEFSFNAMKDSNKLIVSTKNAANYAVIDELLEEIDQPLDAGVPVIMELKHANAEDVAEQLNAMFAEPGTPAAITRNERGLSDKIREISSASDRDNSGNANQNNNQNRNTQGGGEVDPTQMNFWWSQSRPNVNEQPTSNLIGKPRIVPINRRNAIMILAPRSHIQPFRELVTELDRPGMQVVIHAIITEVQHNDETTLGVRFASDPSIFADSRLADQAIGGGINANVAENIFRGDGILNANVNLNLLIQLLMRKVDLSVITEPRLMTADNQEAHFFDGQDIPTITGDFTGNNSNGSITRNFRYEPVGTRLHARPHITQDGDIDLELNLELSRIVNGQTVFGNFIFDRRTTTTHVTLQDGQTIVISGIIEQQDFEEIRKLPLLGDLPLIGGLFRSTDTGVRNREVIAFVTPHIVKKGPARDETTEKNREWLDRIRGAMNNPEAVDGDAREGEADDDLRRFTTPEERGMEPVQPEGEAAE